MTRTNLVSAPVLLEPWGLGEAKRQTLTLDGEAIEQTVHSRGYFWTCILGQGQGATGPVRNAVVVSNVHDHCGSDASSIVLHGDPYVAQRRTEQPDLGETICDRLKV
jgi:hypothetical protein